MLFNSIEFLIFLPIVFLIYWFILNRKFQLQNIFIVVVSYIFYGWWDWRFLILIAFTSLCSYISGQLIKSSRSQDSVSEKKSKRIAKTITASNIIVNLLILGVFKYYNFFADSFVDAFALIGITLQPTTLNLILPVGISFYTFQALSYSIDVYRAKIEPSKDIVAFFAYVSFFPQLVAGPIERATNLLPQFYKERTFNYETAVDGMRQILWGLFKKIVIADRCALYVNEVFGSYEEHTAITLLFGAIFFSFQIYGDFSGYSDIAIGIAKLFGIKLMQNFKLPYFSRDIAEFWRRWHISLTTWFRDYLYIPLGGSKVSKLKAVRNTFIIFLVSGFWHGANWTFIVWGAYHALLFLPLILMGKNRKYIDIVAKDRYLPNIKELMQMIFTFVLATIGQIIFRAEDITQAIGYFISLFDISLFALPDFKKTLTLCNILLIIFMLVFEWFQRTKEHVLELSSLSKPLRWMIYYVLILIILCFLGKEQTFIYFQF